DKKRYFLCHARYLYRAFLQADYRSFPVCPTALRIIPRHHFLCFSIPADGHLFMVVCISDSLLFR
ncbi:hypothetical protein, partial [Cronobacter sakazakii]|uniref:hypothetical protein n=2 Tax=Cronobacter sakazakii TaxID=28141 RepID=UPI0020CB0BEE